MSRITYVKKHIFSIDISEKKIHIEGNDLRLLPSKGWLVHYPFLIRRIRLVMRDCGNPTVEGFLSHFFLFRHFQSTFSILHGFERSKSNK